MSISSTPDDAPGRGMRLAVLGASHWHFMSDARYFNIVKDLGMDVVGLQDDDEAMAKQRAEEAGCPWTLDVDELVSRFSPDLVLALPRPDHAAEQVGRLLDLGVPMLAEKPLGLRASEVWSLVERAEQGWVTVAFNQRYWPFWSHYQRLVDADAFGPIIHIGVRQVNRPASRYPALGSAWLLDPEQGGGGPLRNIGIHSADMVVKLLGDERITITGASATQRGYHLPIEDYIVGIGKTDQGAVVTLQTGYTYANSRPNDFDIHISAQHVYMLLRPAGLHIAPLHGDPEYHPMPEDINLFRLMWLDALRRFRAGQPPAITVRDCAKAMELVDDIYDAAT